MNKYIRWILTVIVLALVWTDNKWALYIIITALTIGNEFQTYFNEKVIESLKLLK